jgi:DNA polymerase III delta prime subunit
LRTVAGQLAARRALEITAAGGHNLLLYGPPGTGKSLLAGLSPGHTAPPGDDELLTVLALHDLYGERVVTRQRPFERPTTAPAARRWSAAARCRGRERSPWRMVGYCSSTSCRSFPGTPWTCSANRWKPGP